MQQTRLTAHVNATPVSTVMEHFVTTTARKILAVMVVHVYVLLLMVHSPVHVRPPGKVTTVTVTPAPTLCLKTTSVFQSCTTVYVTMDLENLLCAQVKQTKIVMRVFKDGTYIFLQIHVNRISVYVTMAPVQH